MKKIVTTYLCDICGREFDENRARGSFYNAKFTVLKNTWECEVITTTREFEDVCADCMNELSRTIERKIDDLKKGN